MGSWYVERLLLDRESIRERLFSGGDIAFEYESEDYYPVVDLNDLSLYDDLLSVEMKMDEMILDGRISQKELDIYDLVKTNRPFVDLEKETGMQRQHISHVFRTMCIKIGNELGGCFTDDGLVESLKVKYKLSDKEVDQVIIYLSSSSRQRIRRNKIEND